MGTLLYPLSSQKHGYSFCHCNDNLFLCFQHFYQDSSRVHHPGRYIVFEVIEEGSDKSQKMHYSQTSIICTLWDLSK